MSKVLKSIGSSSVRYGRSLDSTVSRSLRRRTYGRLGPVERYEPAASPSFGFRVPRKLRISRLGSRRASNTSQGKSDQVRLGKSATPAANASTTFLGRLRDRYEKLMRKAGSKSGDQTAIPVAKASIAPPMLAAAFGSRHGTKVSDLDPGFRMTTAEKKYVEHLKRTVSYGRV